MNRNFISGLTRGLAGILLAGGMYFPSISNYGAESLILRTNQNKETLDQRIKRHEGFESKVYKDTNGILTIGYGFNLNRKDASKMLENVGANYDKIVNGKEELSESQAHLLYLSDRPNMDNWARFCVKNYDSHPEDVRDVIVEMVYNCGATGFKGFKKTISALEKYDYKTAADEMVRSKWYKQTGNRAKELVNKVRNAYKDKD